MKVSAVLLCLVLAAASVSSQVLESHTPMACCVVTMKRKLPFQRLESYQRISNSHCLQEAVIFKTKLGREICADPREKWVKNFMKLLDQKSQALKPSEPSYMH